MLCVAFVITLYSIAKERNIKFSILWLSVLSTLSCVLYLAMDAPDVAMTEAALGSCITTVIFLKVAQICESNDKSGSVIVKIAGLVISAAFGAILIYAGQDIAPYGSNLTAVQTGVQDYYNANTYEDIGIPSFVAAILASYRGYDTLGETSVIFIAGLSVVMIIFNKKYQAHYAQNS